MSGVDSDLLGKDVLNSDKYMGHYFGLNDVKNLISEHKKMVEETGREGVDMLLTG